MDKFADALLEKVDVLERSTFEKEQEVQELRATMEIQEAHSERVKAELAST